MHIIKHDTPSVQQEVVPVMASRQHGLRLQSLGESRQRVTPSRDGLETANASSSSGGVVIGARTAWDDSDDANARFGLQDSMRPSWLCSSIEVQERKDRMEIIRSVRSQRIRTNNRANWARISATGGVEVAGNEKIQQLSRTGGAMVEDLSPEHSKVIRRGMLEATRLQDANVMEPSSSALRTVEFHQHRTLLLTAGLDKKIRLFDIDGGNNRHVQSVFLEDLPIYKSGFCGDGSKILAAGRRRFIYSYDMCHGSVERVSPILNDEIRSLEHFVGTPPGAANPMLAFLGTDGNIPLLSLKSMCCIATVKMNGSARTATFSPDGLQLMTAGKDGIVYFWDLRHHKRCVHKLVDEGSVAITSLATSACDRYLAVGSDCGAVNFYENAGTKKPSMRVKQDGNYLNFGKPDWSERKECTGMHRAFGTQPTGSILNLTTEVNEMNFNADSQILAVSSHLKRDSLRLVHVPSCTVFSDWPSSKTPLQYVWSTAFSSSGGYFAVGNARGRALLYRIHAYDV